MKIKEFYQGNRPVLSLEIFPPGINYPLESIFATLDKLTKLEPSFISVTYGAGGSNRARTAEIAARIKQQYGMEALAHLTCVGHSRAEVDAILNNLIAEGIDNIMALRGDLPTDDIDFDLSSQDYHYAVELIRDIRKKSDFGIAAAAYPDGHPECRRLSEDLIYIRQKVNAGADLLITQFFFDNRIYYDFLEKALRVAINVPIIPGIMPVLNAHQIKRMIYLGGASIPARLMKLVDKYENDPEGMEKAGIEYASLQIEDLINNHV
ncbi:MAG: methylenetetrahydrofolate reductase, partial [Syntrophomonas sp.]|nr:methylenetetrahydrofolate reductase [Syntrophomonas sp.]